MTVKNDQITIFDGDSAVRLAQKLLYKHKLEIDIEELNEFVESLQEYIDKYKNIHNYLRAQEGIAAMNIQN